MTDIKELLKEFKHIEKMEENKLTNTLLKAKKLSVYSLTMHLKK